MLDFKHAKKVLHKIRNVFYLQVYFEDETLFLSYSELIYEVIKTYNS